jgi:hypothetical protein
MIIHEMDQGSDEWREVRMGKITASIVSTLLVNGKSNILGVGAYTEMRKLVEERITKVPRKSFKAASTDWGHDNEPLARKHYERLNFQKVEEVGFCEMNEWIGCSPDGLVGRKKGTEIKCLPTQHIEILDTGACKDLDKFKIQCQFSLWVTKYLVWDLCFYHDSFPDHLKMIIMPQYPDKALHAKFEERTDIFIKEALQMESRLLNR